MVTPPPPPPENIKFSYITGLRTVQSCTVFCHSAAGANWPKVQPHNSKTGPNATEVLTAIKETTETSVPEFIDPVFTKTSPKRSFSLNRKRAFWRVFVKTGSIISGTGDTNNRGARTGGNNSKSRKRRDVNHISDVTNRQQGHQQQQGGNNSRNATSSRDRKFERPEAGRLSTTVGTVATAETLDTAVTALTLGCHKQ